ncbi:MAG: transcriptional repressor LexA [Gammaproteobacteria bacterium]
MLTERETQVLQIIAQHLAQHGAAPSLDEIAAALGIHSKGTVHRYVQSLVTAGYLKPAKGRWRALRLAKTQLQAEALPLVGRIAAGRPLEAIQGMEAVNLNGLLVRPGRFLIRVTGESMRDAGILDGDLVVVDRRDSAETGEIVVALIDGQEATLKRLGSHTNGRVELRPANPDFPLQIYAAERVRIQGVVVGNVRVYSTRPVKR